MKPYRVQRVAEVVRKIVSPTILFEVNDPRIRNVTITRVEVSADLQHAKVYVSVMGSEQEQRECLEALQRARGFVQKKLGQQLATRYLPTLTFILDKGVKNSLQVAAILRKEQEARAKLAESDQPAAGEAAPAASSLDGSNPEEGTSPTSSLQ